VRRERLHRGALLVAITVLLLLTMTPLVGVHLPLGLDRALAGHDHLWAICMVALQALLSPVHHGFRLLLAAGLAYAAWDRVRAWRALRSTVARMAAAPVQRGTSLHAATLLAGVDPARVHVVLGLPVPAFTAGWVRPRIYLADALRETLAEREIAAVIAHEGAHLARRDPLLLSVLRFLSCTLFWLPALRRLAEDVADEREVAADDAAARAHGLALASALVRLAAWQRPVPGAVGVNGGDLLERRVIRLTGGHAPPVSRLTRRSVIGAVAVLLLAAASSAVAASPAAGGHGGHCEHHGIPLLHLFCPARAALPAACTHGGG
jgi:Zn-dependent protease with chaperone function